MLGVMTYRQEEQAGAGRLQEVEAVLKIVYPPGQSEDHTDNDGLDNILFIDDLNNNDKSPDGLMTTLQGEGKHRTQTLQVQGSLGHNAAGTGKP